MAQLSIRAEGLWKEYTLGERNARMGSLRRALAARLRGRPLPERERFWALKDVGFEVAPGEVLGIIGANGSGKSTLLKLLSGITEPTRGWAEIRGRVGSLLEVGTGFHPELTGRENVFLQGSILGLSYGEIRQRFDRIVAFSELEAFLDTPVKRYSSGMYVRLAFAVAAHLDTDVLLVDEVLAVGDAAFRRKCTARMREVAGGGRTVVFVSHDLGAVESLCSRALWLESGRIRGEGEPSELTSGYLGTAVGAGDAVDLAGHPGRTGVRPLLRRLAVLDDAGRPCRSLASGAGLRVRVAVDLPEPLAGGGLVLGFHSELGQLVAVSSSFDHAPLRLSAGAGELEGRLPGLELTPGIYALTLELVDAGQRRLDLVEDATRLLVTPRDRGESAWRHSPRERAWVAASEWRAVTEPDG